ncbi:hypothetical protein EMIHUDRAFT_235616 [Emiliania huxleyi CCMP1516]|uniref:Uncharacterized protein n=2 Tax=Emiliania huxleyi TaxID=2903 RepID=A0A0D3JVJ8_EMIH1|nr:hypothetical protein EMIHUDRAFT_235616 [Emiliania huxleyi CCMP1516]EOD27533.1 hypothetical protein EMIHUDRAFT_235616 [Emiliania huxleyi CCMP1516]|eukprot:XP_005779962.1 hypothetical protein EMIHUDRAFT_235616 [Emiliania huxleyi CCMP1516]
MATSSLLLLMLAGSSALRLPVGTTPAVAVSRAPATAMLFGAQGQSSKNPVKKAKKEEQPEGGFGGFVRFITTGGQTINDFGISPTVVAGAAAWILFAGNILLGANSGYSQ